MNGGTTVDYYHTPFGIRSFNFDPAKGFSINGQGLKLKGVCLHHDAGALGAAVPVEVWAAALETPQGGGLQRHPHQPQPARSGLARPLRRDGLRGHGRGLRRMERGKNKWLAGHGTWACRGTTATTAISSNGPTRISATWSFAIATIPRSSSGASATKSTTTTTRSPPAIPRPSAAYRRDARSRT